MGGPKPEDFPFDKSINFIPKACYYINQTFGLSTDIQVKDVTPRLKDDEIPEHLTETFAQQVSEYADNSSPVLYIKRESLISSRMKVTTGDRRQVAELGNSLLSLGTAKIEFPLDSVHSSHNLEIKPVGMFRRAQYFVKDSGLYFWENVTSKERLLCKVVGSGRIVIGKWQSVTGNQYCGVLILDNNELNSVIAIVSCVVQLNQSDSFTK